MRYSYSSGTHSLRSESNRFSEGGGLDVSRGCVSRGCVSQCSKKSCTQSKGSNTEERSAYLDSRRKQCRGEHDASDSERASGCTARVVSRHRDGPANSAVKCGREAAV